MRKAFNKPTIVLSSYEASENVTSLLSSLNELLSFGGSETENGEEVNYSDISGMFD